MIPLHDVAPSDRREFLLWLVVYLNNGGIYRPYTLDGDRVRRGSPSHTRQNGRQVPLWHLDDIDEGQYYPIYQRETGSTL